MSAKKIFQIIVIIGLTFWVSACKVIPAAPSPTGNHTNQKRISATQSSIVPTTTPPPPENTFPAPILSTLAPSETPAPAPVTVSFQAEQNFQAAQATPLPYDIQAGSPSYLPNFSRPNLGCNVQAVAGQVFDQNGIPVKNLVVEVQGVLNGIMVDNIGLTGNTTTYGPGGYEVDLGTQVYASSHSLSIWLIDQGNEVSARKYFDTFQDCQKNIILINFQVNLPNKYYFPSIFR